MSFSIWELIYFCMQFSKYMSDWSLSVIKNQNLFWSLITGKNQLSQQHCPADWVDRRIPFGSVSVSMLKDRRGS